jgi:hypothetical protein
VIPLGKSDIDVEITLLDYNNSQSVSESFDFKPSPGFMVGGSFGIKAGGPGTLFIDIRYGMDFSDTKVEFEQRTASIFKRSVLHFLIGYEIGLIKKYKRKNGA